MAGAQNDGLSLAERRRRLEAQRAQQGHGGSGAARGATAAEGAAATPEVPLHLLVHNPRNARRALEGIEGLADSFESGGLLQPCLVVPVATFRAAFPECAADLPGEGYVVLGGNRRLAAAQQAGLASLPVHVNAKLQTREQILVAAATENIAREELKPFEELDTIEDLKSMLGTYDAVAKKLGMSAGWVSQRRRLANLQPELRQALESRAPGMTIELARSLGKIKDREGQLKAWEAARQRAEELDSETPDTSQAPRKKKGKVPAQKKAVETSAPLDEAAKARRDSCRDAVGAGAGDLARLCLIAAQSPAAPDEAAALAGQWLTEAAAGSSALNLSTLASEEGSERQHQAAIAIALAHCELHMTRTGGSDAVHARAYTDWLETHTDYQPAHTEPAATA
ncbi:ParB/RepB/Spo0J family partition protein [Streptomyces filamentosus]|uniref:ParB/RepB/Spo0J family partition protein n=1 Tax=Streptomyces filamentosus TaxID=67294 RepID=UPI0036F02E73